MKKYLLLILSICVSSGVFAQSTDEKVGAMMNNGKWFELREFYEANTDSIHPFLNLFGKAMLANFFNKPDEAISYCGELLNSGQLDLNNVVSIGSILCTNLSKLGQNEMAFQTMESINNSIAPYYQHLDSATINGIRTNISLYRALSKYNVNELKPFEEKVQIPFQLMPVGPDKSKSVYMSVNGAINGRECDMGFDTGAGVNVMSDSVAANMGIDILDATLVAEGIGTQTAKLAIVKELNIGGLTIFNVPFYIMTIKSGNDEADDYMRHLQVVVGRNIMETMKYLTIDFTNNVISVLKESDIPADINPNLCIGNSGNYQLLCRTTNGEKLILNPDTGDASFGVLFPNTKSMFQQQMPMHRASDKKRMAGAGGFVESQYYIIDNMPIDVCGRTVVIPEMTLLENGFQQSTQSGYDGRMGIETFRLFDSVTFDLSRMIMYPNPGQ